MAAMAGVRGGAGTDVCRGRRAQPQAVEPVTGQGRAYQEGPDLQLGARPDRVHRPALRQVPAVPAGLRDLPRMSVPGSRPEAAEIVLGDYRLYSLVLDFPYTRLDICSGSSSGASKGGTKPAPVSSMPTRTGAPRRAR